MPRQLATGSLTYIIYVGKKQRQVEETGITCKIDPRLGFFSLNICRIDMTMTNRQMKVRNKVWQIMRLEKAQYNPSRKLIIDISRVVEAPIEEIFIIK